MAKYCPETNERVTYQYCEDCETHACRKKGNNMRYIEESGDVFSVPSDYHLAHCISADFKMGAGIAVEFDKRFDMEARLTEMYPRGYIDENGELNPAGCVLVDNVLNLITKRRYYERPTYNALTKSLRSMRDICESNGIKKVAMPTIGCGLDGLRWDKVSEIIIEVFRGMDIEVLICRK